MRVAWAAYESTGKVSLWAFIYGLVCSSLIDQGASIYLGRPVRRAAPSRLQPACYCTVLGMLPCRGRSCVLPPV